MENIIDFMWFVNESNQHGILAVKSSLKEATMQEKNWDSKSELHFLGDENKDSLIISFGVNKLT